MDFGKTDNAPEKLDRKHLKIVGENSPVLTNISIANDEACSLIDTANAHAWGHHSCLNFFETNRLTTKDIYPSEWFFLRKFFQEKISVLDIGCAKGGLANILSENLKEFSYTGIDINQHMVQAARLKYPQHNFYHIQEDNNYAALGVQQFDLVTCLGILHLHEKWKDTIQNAWQRTERALILDLRETHCNTIEDKNISYFSTNFDNPGEFNPDFTLPYNIINTSEALRIIHEICTNAYQIYRYGYIHAISDLAVSPVTKVMTNVYCIEKR